MNSDRILLRIKAAHELFLFQILFFLFWLKINEKKFNLPKTHSFCVLFIFLHVQLGFIFELDDKKSANNRRMRMANWLDMNIEHLANPPGQWYCIMRLWLVFLCRSILIRIRVWQINLFGNTMLESKLNPSVKFRR